MQGISRSVERKEYGQWRVRWVLENDVVIDWDVLHMNCQSETRPRILDPITGQPIHSYFYAAVPTSENSPTRHCRFCKEEVPPGVMLLVGARRMK